MNALTKNKEEIEKIGKDAEDSLEQGEYNLNASILEATIKTSILWCEDEIEEVEYIAQEISRYECYNCSACDNNVAIFDKLITHYKKKLEQLQTHLNWLKEQK